MLEYKYKLKASKLQFAVIKSDGIEVTYKVRLDHHERTVPVKDLEAASDWKHVGEVKEEPKPTEDNVDPTYGLGYVVFFDFANAPRH